MARRPLSVSSSGQNKSISRSRRCGRSGKVKRKPANRRPAGPRSDQICSLLLVTRLAPNKLTVNTAAPSHANTTNVHTKMSLLVFQPFQLKNCSLILKLSSQKTARVKASPPSQFITGLRASLHTPPCSRRDCGDSAIGLFKVDFRSQQRDDATACVFSTTPFLRAVTSHIVGSWHRQMAALGINAFVFPAQSLPIFIGRHGTGMRADCLM